MTMASDHGADVVVVSGGIRGECIAYYLARAGVGVTLVEKGFLGKGFLGPGASIANAGLVNVSQEVPVSPDRARYSLRASRTSLPSDIRRALAAAEARRWRSAVRRS